MTDKAKDFNEWRAEKLGYMYFSRLQDLIIQELDNHIDPLFDYLIDIGDNQKLTGRYFVVEVKSLNSSEIKDIIKEEYRNIPMPALLVLFDHKTDQGYFKWIKKPLQNGQLVFEAPENDMQDLNNDTLHQIVTEIKNWYAFRQSHKQVA